MYKYITLFSILIFSFQIESSVRPISQISELQSIITKETLVIVDFYADWCRPCKNLSPILTELSKEYPQATFVKINIDQAENIAKKYNIQSIPTLLIFKDGKKVDTIIGGQSKTTIRNKIRSQL